MAIISGDTETTGYKISISFFSLILYYEPAEVEPGEPLRG